LLITKNCLDFINKDDEEIKYLSNWIISYISETEEINIIEEILRSNMIQDICESTSFDPSTVFCKIRIVGNIAGNDDVYVNFLLKRNILNFFKNLLNIENYSILKELFWALSNIVATNRNSCLQVLEDEEIVHKIKKNLFFNNHDVREEVLYIIGTIISNADYIITRKILDYKIDDDILELLKESKNPELIKMIVNALNQLVSLPFFKKKENSNGILLIQFLYFISTSELINLIDLKNIKFFELFNKNLK